MACGGEEGTGPSTDTPDAAAAPDGAVAPDDGGVDPGDTEGPAQPEWMGRDLFAAGPWRVGFRSFEHTYVPWPGAAPRTLRVQAWYPTEARDGEPASYLGSLFVDENALTDAPLATGVWPGGFPVHVYSHGDQGFGGTSGFLMRAFASHGWVSLACDHTGNVLGANEQPRPTALYLHRPLDISATLDAFGALPPEDPLAGVLDLARVVVSGHSFGVHTIWALAGATFRVDGIRQRCEAGEIAGCDEALLERFAEGTRDPRIVAGIPMAQSINRTWFTDDAHEVVTIPMLSLSGTEDQVGADRQYETTAPVPLIWVELAGGCHQAFALGACPNLEESRGWSLVQAYALAFAQQHVLGGVGAQGAALLAGTDVPAEATFRRRP
jgi:predicted dienelactone hydrolase